MRIQPIEGPVLDRFRYEFYEGSTGTTPLTIFPQHAALDACDSQQYFRAAGGVEPHMFSFLVSGSLSVFY
jgi:hypothetical protein